MAGWWNQFGKSFDEVNDRLGGFGQFVKTLAGRREGQPTGFGAAGLAPAVTAPGVAIGATAMAPIAASAAVPLAAAYGMGKLIAPEATDRVVSGVKDWWENRARPVVERAMQAGSAYETGMAESLPGAKFAERALPESTRQTLGEIKAAAPGAAMAGQVAGNVGQMAIPGATVVKGAGLAGGLANAAVNALPYAVGAGLDVGAETGSAGKGILAGLASEGVGTLAPVALEQVVKIPAVRQFLAKVQAAGAGIRTRDIFGVLRGWGKRQGMTSQQIDTYVLKNAEPLMEKVADQIGEFGSTQGGKKALKTWADNGWEAHAQLYDGATGGHVTVGDMAEVAKDPDLVRAGAFRRPDVEARVKTMGEELEGKDWRTQRQLLSDYMQAGNPFARKKANLSPNDPKVLDAEVAAAWHDYVDSGADHLAAAARSQGVDIPELDMLKATHPAVLAMTKAGAREEGKIAERFAGGSDTALRVALMGVGPLALAPGAVAETLEDPQALGKNLLKMAGASTLGRLLTRGAGKVGELGAGAIAGALRGAEGPSAALGRMAAKVTEAAVGSAATTPPAEEEPPAGAPPGAEAIPTATPDMRRTAEQIVGHEAEAGPQVVEAARQGIANSPVFDRMIREKVYNDWLNWDNPLKPDFQTFFDDTKNYTGGFNPMREETMVVLGGANYKQYQRAYQSALALETLGADLARAIAYNPTMGVLASRRDPAAAEAHDRVVQSLWTAMSGEAKPPGARDRADIERRLRLMRLGKMDGNRAYRKLLDMMQQEMGLDVESLRRYGVIR